MIRNNIAYALDGMINHTAVDWPSPGQRKHFHGIDHVDTCVMVTYFNIINIKKCDIRIVHYVD